MKVIAITQRTHRWDDIHESRDCLDQRWMTVFEKCDFLPLILPNYLPMAQKILTQFAVDGIILTGGNASLERDEVERFLISYAELNTTPLLGICHGMQMIQKYYGVDLIPVVNHVVKNQKIDMNGKTIVRDSYHDFGTTDNKSPLVVLGRADDGVIKAISHEHFPFLGLMWHPERSNFLMDDLQTIKNLFEGELACALSF